MRTIGQNRESKLFALALVLVVAASFVFLGSVHAAYETEERPLNTAATTDESADPAKAPQQPIQPEAKPYEYERGNSRSMLGGVVHATGEIISFPFRMVGETVRLIF